MTADDLIYPRTRFKVLRTLNYSETPMSLHEISERADLIIGSAQTALSWLLKAKIVSIQKLDNRTYYQLKNKSAKEIISKIQDVLEPIELQERAKQFQARARNLLEDLEDRRTIVEIARSSVKL